VPTFVARPALAADYAAFVGLFPELGVDDPLPDLERWIDVMMPGTLILEHEGAAVGYSWTKVFGDAAYVFNVVVAQGFRGRGAGRALMDAIAASARAAGVKRWSLNVKIDNEPALRLYERCGLVRVFRSASLALPWDGVAALPRDTNAATAHVVDAAEDASLESAFDVMPGRLADFRQQGRTLIALVEAGVPAGLAAFNPSFPGAFPFAVTRPELAAPLLEAMRPHARPGDTFVRIGVEHDMPLVDALRTAGAEVKLDLFHMEGDIEKLPAR
jgi:GNAT superfamily N-acetyltransferase